MAQLTLKDPNFTRMRRRAGLFGIFALLAVIATVSLLAVQKGLLTRTIEYRISARTGNDLFVGMDVKLLGVKIGRLTRLEMSPEAKISGEVEIDQTYERWVRADSELQVLKSGFIGGAFLELKKGSPEAPALPALGTVSVRAVGGIEDITENVSQMISKLNKIVDYVDDPGGDIKKTLANAAHIAAEVDAMMMDIHKATPDAPKISKNVAVATEKVSSLIESTQGTIEKLTVVAGRLDEVMTMIQTTASSIAVAAQDAQKMIGDISRSSAALPETLDTAESTLREVRTLSQNLRESWLLRTAAKEPEEGPKLQAVRRLLGDAELSMDEEKYDTALSKLLRSLDTARSIDDQEGIIRSLLLLGSVYQRLDKESDAEKPLSEAFTRSGGIAGTDYGAEASVRWAEWNLNKGRVVEASEALQRAEGYVNMRKDSVVAIRHQWIRSLIQGRQGQLSEAAESLEKVMKRAEKAFKAPERGRVYESSGDLALQRKQPQVAAQYFERALAEYKTSASSVRIGRALVKLAQAYREQQQPDRSLDVLARAYEVQKTSGQNDSAIQTLDLMTPLLRDKQEADKLAWLDQERKKLRRPGK